jgi:hypothetical protein
MKLCMQLPVKLIRNRLHDSYTAWWRHVRGFKIWYFLACNMQKMGTLEQNETVRFRAPVLCCRVQIVGVVSLASCPPDFEYVNVQGCQVVHAFVGD